MARLNGQLELFPLEKRNWLGFNCNFIWEESGADSLCNYSAQHGLALQPPNSEREAMQIAPEITFEGSDTSDAAHAQIMSEIERLESHNQRITGCRVKVIAPSHKHRHGVGFHVHIWLTLPSHENIVVNTASNDTRHEHAQAAIKDAFAAARRQIDELTA